MEKQLSLNNSLQVVHRARVLSIQDAVSDLEYMLESIEHKLRPWQTRSGDKILLTSAKESLYVRYSEILYCQASSNYTMVHLENGKKILLSKTLKKFSAELPKTDFVRSHQSYLLNISHIAKCIGGLHSTVELQNGMQLPVARRRKGEVRKRLK